MLILNEGAPQRTLFGSLSFLMYLGNFCTPEPTDYICVDDMTAVVLLPTRPHPQSSGVLIMRLSGLVVMMWNWTHRKHRRWHFRGRWQLLTCHRGWANCTSIFGEVAIGVTLLLRCKTEVGLPHQIHCQQSQPARIGLYMLYQLKKSLYPRPVYITDKLFFRLWNMHVGCDILS